MFQDGSQALKKETKHRGVLGESLSLDKMSGMIKKAVRDVFYRQGVVQGCELSQQEERNKVRQAELSRTR